MQWDSPQMGIRLIIGLILTLGLYGFVWDGIVTLSYQTKQTEQQIDLVNASDYTVQSGYTTVQGYPSYVLDNEYVDYTGDLLDTVTYHYIALLTDPNTKIPRQSPLILVKLDTANTTYSKVDTISYDPTQAIQIQGTIGFTADQRLKEFSKEQFLQDFAYPDTKIVILDEAKQVPQLNKLLTWFIPVTLTFLVGLFFVLQWLYALKTQFFGLK